jgi:hypothetical protein
MCKTVTCADIFDCLLLFLALHLTIIIATAVTTIATFTTIATIATVGTTFYHRYTLRLSLSSLFPASLAAFC